VTRDLRGFRDKDVCGGRVLAGLVQAAREPATRRPAPSQRKNPTLRPATARLRLVCCPFRFGTEAFPVFRRRRKRVPPYLLLHLFSHVGSAGMCPPHGDRDIFLCISQTGRADLRPQSARAVSKRKGRSTAVHPLVIRWLIAARVEGKSFGKTTCDTFRHRTSLIFVCGMEGPRDYFSNLDCSTAIPARSWRG
jgi:hypothetical protein